MTPALAEHALAKPCIFKRYKRSVCTGFRQQAVCSAQATLFSESRAKDPASASINPGEAGNLQG